MPALQARVRVGLSAAAELASTRMAAGLPWIMSFSEAIWSDVVAPAFWIEKLILPLNGGRFEVRVATRSISGRQSLPRKLLLRTIL